MKEQHISAKSLELPISIFIPIHKLGFFVDLNLSNIEETCGFTSDQIDIVFGITEQDQNLNKAFEEAKKKYRFRVVYSRQESNTTLTDWAFLNAEFRDWVFLQHTDTFWLGNSKWLKKAWNFVLQDKDLSIVAFPSFDDFKFAGKDFLKLQDSCCFIKKSYVLNNSLKFAWGCYPRDLNPSLQVKEHIKNGNITKCGKIIPRNNSLFMDGGELASLETYFLNPKIKLFPFHKLMTHPWEINKVGIKCKFKNNKLIYNDTFDGFIEYASFIITYSWMCSNIIGINYNYMPWSVCNKLIQIGLTKIKLKNHTDFYNGYISNLDNNKTINFLKKYKKEFVEPEINTVIFNDRTIDLNRKITFL